MSKKTVLMLAATPPDHPKLDVMTEHDQIKDLLERGDLLDTFALELRASAKWGDFPREILNKNPTVVHFSGHGAGAKGLLLRDQSTTSRLATTDELAKLFRMAEHQIECVLLNACMSVEQAVEIVKYVPYVIGMKHEIGDAAAVDFAQGFYLAYFAGQSVGASFKWGCDRIRTESLRDDLRRHVGTGKAVAAALPEDLKPTLLIRPDVFVACHEDIDIPVQQEFKDVKELEVFGDWQCRQDDRIPGGRTLSFGVARNVLVALTDKWCQDVYAPPENPRRVSHKDPRVRVILWEKFDPPTDFKDLTKFDFHEVQKRPEVLKLLIETLKPKSRSAPPQEKGIEAVRKLAQEPAVQAAGKGVKETLVETSSNLNDLSRWKNLHAQMHYLEKEIANLEGSLEQVKHATNAWKENEIGAERLRAVEDGWDNAKLPFDNLKAALDSLIANGDLENFTPEEFQRDAFHAAAALLETNFKARNLRELPEDLLQVQTLLEQHMPRVDKRLFESAGKVPLERLVASLNEILTSTRPLATDADKAALIEEFRNGIRAISELQETLKRLVLKQNHLQNIADSTKLLHDRTANAVRIRNTMTNVTRLYQRHSAAVQDGWVEEFGRRLSAVNDAIPPALTLGDAEPSQLRRAVAGMLNYLDIGFFKADESLKRFCGELEKLRHGLDKMIEGL